MLSSKGVEELEDKTYLELMKYHYLSLKKRLILFPLIIARKDIVQIENKLNQIQFHLNSLKTINMTFGIKNNKKCTYRIQVNDESVYQKLIFLENVKKIIRWLATPIIIFLILLVHHIIKSYWNFLIMLIKLLKLKSLQ